MKLQQRKSISCDNNLYANNHVFYTHIPDKSVDVVVDTYLKEV